MEKEPLGLRVLDLLGVFYLEGDRLMVADEFEGAKDVYESLEKLKGRRVRLLAHHSPPEPPDNARWGGGSCMMESSGHCHFGHHEEPGNIFQFDATGDLGPDDEGWGVVSNSGTQIHLYDGLLVGHRSRIVVLAFPELQNMKAKVESLDPENLKDANLEDLQEHFKEVRDYLLEIQKLKNDIDV
jgi:hypothetical protein